jgi:hypothetical protein
MKNPTVPAFTYKLVLDLLMSQDGYYKIFIPDSLIGALLSYTHLLGQKGITRMLADLQSYYFKNMYSITRNFISCCWSCFLVNRGVKKNQIETYPTPTYPFEEITLDLHSRKSQPRQRVFPSFDSSVRIFGFYLNLPVKITKSRLCMQNSANQCITAIQCVPIT